MKEHSFFYFSSYFCFKRWNEEAVVCHLPTNMTYSLDRLPAKILSIVISYEGRGIDISELANEMKWAEPLSLLDTQLRQLLMSKILISK